MYSVTYIVRHIKQPRGGYINQKLFSTTHFEDGKELFDKENINPALVGMAVDYLTRFSLDTPKEDAFKVSLAGARRLGREEISKSEEMLSHIKGLDDDSIYFACQIVGYDIVYRQGPGWYVLPAEEIKPDKNTIHNIRIMVERGISFIRKYGPITHEGMTFGRGYTGVVSSGDADFMTENTIWDFKCIRDERIDGKHTLQLAIYYLLGKHSEYDFFQKIDSLGVFNPRHNKVYLLKVTDVSPEIWEEISAKVIGYPSEKFKSVTLENFSEFRHIRKKRTTITFDNPPDGVDYFGGR